MAVILDKLNLKNSENLSKLFGEDAQEVAKQFNDGNRPEISTTQFRKFYEKVSSLLEEAESLNNDEFKTIIAPQFVILKSKSNYAKERKVASENVVKLFSNKISNVEELKNFKLFMESVIGYMPKK
jgi:CRISPR type III-A-associated protein Csm2